MSRYRRYGGEEDLPSGASPFGDYRKVFPGQETNFHHTQNTAPDLMLPPRRARGVTSQSGNSKSVLDWLGQGHSDAAGKNLVPIKGLEKGTHSGTRVGPFGPIDAPSQTNGQNIAPANGHSEHDRKDREEPGLQPPGAHTQGSHNPTTSFTPLLDFQNPFTTRRPPSGNISGPAVGWVEEHSKSNDIVFDAVHDPSDPAKKDVTFRVTIPIEEDFEPNLEEFCRLRRLGRFSDAEEHFQHTLSHLRGNPYVLVQYCEMLLASGSYNAFRAVSHRDKYPSLGSEERPKDPSLDMLEGNFWLLDVLAKVPQPALDGEIFQAIGRMLGNLELGSAMGSTEVCLI